MFLPDAEKDMAEFKLHCSYQVKHILDPPRYFFFFFLIFQHDTVNRTSLVPGNLIYPKSKGCHSLKWQCSVFARLPFIL